MSEVKVLKQQKFINNPNKNQRYLVEAENFSKGLSFEEEVNLDYVLVDYCEEEVTNVNNKQLDNQISIDAYLESLLILPLEKVKVRKKSKL